MVDWLLLGSSVILFGFYGGYYMMMRYYLNKESQVFSKCDEDFFPSVSVVVATHNEANMIKSKLQNLLDLEYPGNKLEYIFVDSSTDETRRILREFEKATSSLGVLLIEEERRAGLATALNLGYKCANGEIVVKSDCDMMLDKSALKEIVKPFADPAVGAVSGVVIISNLSLKEISYRSLFERLRAAEANMDSTYLFNPFSAFRKSLVEPIDRRSVADDAELALKIRKKGFRTVYSQEAISYEVSPTSIRERILQKSRRAGGHICLLIQNLDVLFNPKYGRFGLIIFPANFFMMIISPWLMLLVWLLSIVYLFGTFGVLPTFLVATSLMFIASLAYLRSKPKIVAGFLDAQLNLLVGFFRLALKGPNYMWNKNRRT